MSSLFAIEPLIEFFILALLPIPFVRLMLARGFRRRMNALRGFTILFFSLVALYYCALVFFLLAFPLILRLAIIPTLLALAILFWYARPAYGKKRGLPPGSLLPIRLQQWQDIDYFAKQAARYGPIFKTSDVYRPCVGIVGMERGRAFLGQYQNDLTVPPFFFNRFIPGGLLRYSAHARHDAYRLRFASAFSARVLNENENYIREITRRALQRMTAAREQSKARGIDPRPHLFQINALALTRVFFGIAHDERAYAELHAQLAIMDYHLPNRHGDAQVHAAIARATQILKQYHSQNDTPTSASFFSEFLRADPNTADDAYIVNNLLFLYFMGAHDLSSLALWILKMLSDNPNWGKQLRALRRADTEHSKANLDTRIVLETLRLAQSEYLLRITSREIQFEGFTIPKNWTVRICIHENHRDANVFEQPNEFNPDRFLQSFPRAQYMPFGFGKHSCLGETLTLLLMRIFVQELTDSFEWRVAQDDAPEYGGFHWQPSPKFRIALQAR